VYEILDLHLQRDVVHGITAYIVIVHKSTSAHHAHCMHPPSTSGSLA